MTVKKFTFPLLVVAGVFLVTSLAVRSPVAAVPRREGPALASPGADISPVVESVDRELGRAWAAHRLEPAEAADDLTILRRLSLALHGTIPSLEEIRRFEADSSPDRLAIRVSEMLDDTRFSDYFAERLARTFVSVDTGQFLIFRRDRFVEWLSESLRKRVAYDRLVREMIAAEGVWTGQPEVNFLTQAYANDEFDYNKLAARTARAFLGQRIDCAQCHDHPFAEWKQSQFEELAACYGQVRLSPLGLNDSKDREFKVLDGDGTTEKVVSPGVPFSSEWMAVEGGRRTRLAEWVTHPENERFARATVNRLWALMFGKPYAAGRPVDDLPNPGDPATADDLRLLDLLARDFRDHGYDLRRTIRVIAASRAFRMSSVHPQAESDRLNDLEQHWAVFPLIRLRPEQVIGAMVQSSAIRTIDQNSHLFSRAIRFFRERDFVNEFGDPGDAELQERPSTIPQALLSMNGQFAEELAKPSPFNSSGRLGQVETTPERLLDDAFLICLTRHPNAEERAVLLPELQKGDSPSEESIQDLFWVLFNCSEFCWNH